MAQKRHNSDMTFHPEAEAGVNGAYTDKVHGKRPSKPRPPLVVENFDLAGVKPSMPLADFFDKMSVDKNADVFIDERDHGKIHEGKERRTIIFSLLSSKSCILRLRRTVTRSWTALLDCYKPQSSSPKQIL